MPFLSQNVFNEMERALEENKRTTQVEVDNLKQQVAMLTSILVGKTTEIKFYDKSIVNDLIKNYTRLPYFNGDQKLLPIEYIAEFEKIMRLYQIPRTEWGRLFQINVKYKNLSWEEKSWDLYDYDELNKLFLKCFWTREQQKTYFDELKREDFGKYNFDEMEAAVSRWFRKFKSISSLGFKENEIVPLLIEKLPCDYTRYLSEDFPTEGGVKLSVQKATTLKLNAGNLKTRFSAPCTMVRGSGSLEERGHKSVQVFGVYRSKNDAFSTNFCDPTGKLIDKNNASEMLKEKHVFQGYQICGDYLGYALARAQGSTPIRKVGGKSYRIGDCFESISVDYLHVHLKNTLSVEPKMIVALGCQEAIYSKEFD